MDKNEVFNTIIDSALYGNLGLFIGSGFSKAIAESKNTSPFQAMNWKSLLDCIISRNKIVLNKSDLEFSSCPAIASKICSSIAQSNSISIEEASLKVKKDICELTSYYASEEQRNLFNPLLKSLEPTWIVTTNYDLLLETILEKTFPIEPTEPFVCSKNFTPVYHIHGVRTNPKSIVITQEDYLEMNRPHEYRLDRLAILLKESTTLMLGYSISDVNVLTAIDWAKNVYSYESNNFSHKLIVVNYDEHCTDIIVNEINSNFIEIKTHSIVSLLEELKYFKENYSKYLQNQQKKEAKILKSLDYTKTDIGKKFLKKDFLRLSLINHYNLFADDLLMPFMLCMTKTFEEAWKLSSKPKNFEGYKKVVEICVDILIGIKKENFHPMLISLILSQFNNVADMVGDCVGQAWSANGYWISVKNKIPKENIDMLKDASRIFYFNLRRLIKDL